MLRQSEFLKVKSSPQSDQIDEKRHIDRLALHSLFQDESWHVRAKIAELLNRNQFDSVYQLTPFIGNKALNFLCFRPETSAPKPGYNYLLAAVIDFHEKPKERKSLLEFIQAILQYDSTQTQSRIGSQNKVGIGRTALHVALLDMKNGGGDLSLDASLIQALITANPALINLPTQQKRALPLELALCNFRADLFRLLLPKTDLHYKNGANKTILYLIMEAEKAVEARGNPFVESHAIKQISMMFKAEMGRRENLSATSESKSIKPEVEPVHPERKMIRVKRNITRKPKKQPSEMSFYDMRSSHVRGVALALAQVQAQYAYRETIKTGETLFLAEREKAKVSAYAFLERYSLLNNTRPSVLVNDTLETLDSFSLQLISNPKNRI